MTFWSRLRPSKLREFEGLFTLYLGQSGTDQSKFSRILTPFSTPHSVQLDACHIVRHYAAPVQGNQKKEDKDSGEPKLNEQITAPSVRLVTAEGHFLVSRYEAMARAKSLNLDLVMVDAQATPPVCKIFDFNKEKYLQQMKEKERSKMKSSALKKGPPKEIRFTGKITQKDLQVKADMVRRLMESGHRVKCTAIEPTESLDSETMLARFSNLIDDAAHVESGPCVEKKQAYIVVRHVKFGTPKKKKASSSSKAIVGDESTDEDADSAHGVSDIRVDTSPSPKPGMVINRYAAAAVKPPPPPEFGNGGNTSPPPKPGMVINRYAAAAVKPPPPPEVPSRVPQRENVAPNQRNPFGIPETRTTNRYKSRNPLP